MAASIPGEFTIRAVPSLKDIAPPTCLPHPLSLHFGVNLAEFEPQLCFTTLDREVENRIADLDSQQEKFGVYFNLAFAARRLRQNDAELKYFKGRFKYPDVQNTEAVLEVDRRIVELSPC